MKKMIMAMVMVVSMMAMVMPVMATESENAWTTYQKGQIDILAGELDKEVEMNECSIKILCDEEGQRYQVGSVRIDTEHYYIRVYYTHDNQNGYGSVYFKDGTYIASFNSTSEIDSLVF